MKLIILGKSKDDKGTQLEQLTSRILEFQGYSNIVNNVQVSGASELDVTAFKVDRVGINDIVSPVICECKAHERPISMTDWLKFIGKIHIARKKESRTIGLMLALSGANGAVVGSASSDFKDDPCVQLIANDDIVKLLSKVYNLPEPNIIKDQLTHWPIPAITEIYPVYYNYHIWWLVGCEDGHFTICHSDSKPATTDDVNEILPLLPTATIYQAEAFIDIWNSIETSIQMRKTEKLIVTELLKKSPQETISLRQLYNGIDEHLFYASIKNSMFISIDEEDKYLKLCDFSTISKIELYRFLLDGECPVDVFSSEVYQNNIDENLLEQIWKIQGGFRLPDNYINKCLLLLRLSPSALVYAIQEDGFFHASPAMAGYPDMMSLYYEYFMGKLQESFLYDFKKPELSGFYLHTKSINKVKITISSYIDFEGKVPIEISVEQNYALAKLEEHNQTVLVRTKTNIDTTNKLDNDKENQS